MPEQNDPKSYSSQASDQTISPFIEAYIDKKLKESQKADEHPGNKSWKRSWRSASPITKASIGLSAAVALATVAYVFIALFQLIEMRESITAVQRSFVYPAPIGVFPVKDSSNSISAWNISYWWENSGETPARFVTQHMNFQEMLGTIPDGFSYPDLGTPDSSTTFIAPKAKLGVPGFVVPLDVMNRVTSGQTHLYFWGWVKYRDGFLNTTEHMTEVCFEVKGDMTGPDVDKGVNFRPDSCRTHNCADDECKVK